MKLLLLTLLVGLATLFACGDNPTENPPVDPGDNDSLPTGIIFSRFNSTMSQAVICRIDTDGTGLDSLTDAAHRAVQPDISPDGTIIAFSSNHFSTADIVLLHFGDTTLTRLTSLTGIEADPSWSPDEARLLFTSQINTGSNRNIYVINADGTGILALTTGSADLHSPTWSRTSADSIYYIGPGGQVHMMNVNDQGSIAIPLGLTDPIGIKFSPVDSTFRMQADIVANPDTAFWHIFRGDFSGAKPTDISDPDMFDIAPTWAPDGSRIVFRSNGFYDYPYDDGLYLCDPDGSNRVQIPGTTTYDFDPCWFPAD